MLQQAKNLYHLAVAVLANLVYGFPSRSLTVIGVTGTDGKTTTANLIYHILTTAHKPCAIISTVGAIINGKEYDTGFHVTTPGSFAIARYLRRAVDEGAKYAVLEATSHGLDQNRLFGIRFAIGIITNITHEHLDYHKTFDRYLTAKAKLLLSSQTVVLNKDDSSFPRLYTICKRHSKYIITYGLQDADVTAKMIRGFRSNLSGEHNRYNILAAVSAVRQLGVGDEMVKKAIRQFRLPKGREEVVYDNDFTVIIDFSHTPNALRQFLKSIRKKRRKGRLIHVFGAAGERDKTKRPMMGEIASQYDDVIILTAEDPRSESAADIAREIERGIIQIGSHPTVATVLDRRHAIEKAIREAKKYDTVVITGKGHERSMNFGKGEEPWSDHAAVLHALKNRHET